MRHPWEKGKVSTAGEYGIQTLKKEVVLSDFLRPETPAPDQLLESIPMAAPVQAPKLLVCLLPSMKREEVMIVENRVSFIIPASNGEKRVRAFDPSLLGRLCH